MPGGTVKQSDTIARVGRWVLLATILGSSLSFIDSTVVNVALPTLQRELRADAASVQWVIEAYALFLAALILVGGSLSDRLGRKRIFAIGVALFALASMACGLAPSIQVLILARAVQGIGGALLVPCSLAILTAYFPEDQRGAAIGSWSAFTTITTAVGPVLGGWLVQVASWRWVFFINAPVAVLTLVILFASVPESYGEDASAGRMDWVGASLATLGLGALTFGLVQSSAWGLRDPRVGVTVVLGVLALGTFVLIEFRREHAGRPAMVPPSLFRSGTFSGANLLTLLLYGALGGALYFIPFDLQQVQGYSAAQAGAALLPFTVVVFLLSRWAGGLVARVGARLPLMIGPVIVAAGFLLYARIGIGGSYWTTFFPAVSIMALGMAIVIAPLTTAVMNAVGAERSGVASGINNAVSRTAGLLAIALFNLLIVAIFTALYSHALQVIPLSHAARASLLAQQTNLAGVRIPTGLNPAQAAAVRSAIDGAFVAGFRGVMLVSAGLAVASSLAAARLVAGKMTKATTQSATDATAPAKRYGRARLRWTAVVRFFR